jgi:Na+/proline symporter
MNYLSVDYFIIYAFLLITLIIGLRAGRGIKDIREYAIGNRSFGTVALVLTYLATNTGIINVVDETERIGITLSISIIMGVAIGPFILALVISSKMGPFSECLTMGDIMGTLYGTYSKIIAGVLGFLTAACIAGMELIVLGLVCESLLGLDYKWGLSLGGLILAIYSAHGGIKAVTATDVFQFLVLLIVFPIIAVWALDHAGGIKAVFEQIPAEKIRVANHPDAFYYLVMLILLDVSQVGMVDPANIQRLLMAKSPRQLRDQFFTLSVLSPVIQLTSMFLALAGMVLYPNLEGTQLVPQIVKDILPVGIKGLAIAGFFSVSIGNTDSYLHAAGLTLVHDVAKPLCDKRGLVINELKWVRYATVLVSALAIIIGFTKTDDLYDLLFISYKFTPILVYPLWSGILGLKPDKYAFYIAAAVTVVVTSIANFLLPPAQNHWVIFISLAVNGVVFWGTHAIRNTGFVIIKFAKDGNDYLWRPRHASILTWLGQLLPTPQRIVRYSQKQVEKYGAPYTLFGIFCCINYLFPYFMWEHNITAPHNLMLYFRTIGAMACGLLLVRDKWSNSFLPYLPTLWHLTLLYCLPFTNTVMFLLTQGSAEWLINVAITIMFLIVLVDWLSFVILSALGVALGFLFYQLRPH